MPPTTAPDPTVAPADPTPAAPDPTTDTPPQPSDADSSSSPLLVTSSSSRAAYSDNASKLATTLSNLPTSNQQTYNFVDASGKTQQVQASSPEEAIKIAPNIAPTSGVEKASSVDGTNGVVNADGTPAPTKPTANADGSTANPDGTTTNTDGTVTTSDGVRLAPGLVSIYNDTSKQLDEGIASAKSNLQAAAATMQNDPAAQNAIALITAKYDQQIAAMKENNRALAGGNIVGAARTGSLQFANEMTSNFLSDEQGRAEQRVTDLITLEASMILKTKQAYQDGDVKAFSAASKALDDAQKGKTDAINKLLDATDKIVKEQQTQAKIDAASAKQKISDDIRVSTGIANTLATAIASSGLTDEKKIRQYVEAMAEKNGISNPDILESAVVKARQTNEKADLSIENTKSIIAKRSTTGNGSSSTATKKSVLDNIASHFGSQDKDASGYSVRGADGYIDPGEYTNAYNQWITKYPDKDFTAKFPVKTLINPASYDSLPPALRPVKSTKAPA